MARHRAFGPEAVPLSAAGSTSLAPGHPSQCEPCETQKAKGDRDADLVQGAFDLAALYRSPVDLRVAGRLLGLSYISVGRAQGSVICITHLALLLWFRTMIRDGSKRTRLNPKDERLSHRRARGSRGSRLRVVASLDGCVARAAFQGPSRLRRLVSWRRGLRAAVNSRRPGSAGRSLPGRVARGWT